MLFHLEERNVCEHHQHRNQENHGDFQNLESPLEPAFFACRHDWYCSQSTFITYTRTRLPYNPAFRRQDPSVVSSGAAVENRDMGYLTPQIKRRAFLALAIAVTLFASVAATRITYRRFQLGREMSDVEKEVASLQEEQDALNEQLASLDDFSTIEQAAREVLNLQQEGEHVVILLPNGQETTTQKEQAPEEEQPEQKG